MMIIEMREAAYEKAFDLLDEMKDLGKKKKMIMCELEDTLYDCYESSKYENEEIDNEEEFEDDEQNSDMNLRYGRRMRRSMRNMRHNEDYDDDMNMRGYRRSRGMRRRNRM